MVVDFYAQVSKLRKTEIHLGESFSVVATRINNGHLLLKLRLDVSVVLPNANLKQKEKRRLTWRAPKMTQRWTWVDHISISLHPILSEVEKVIINLKLWRAAKLD